MGPKGIGLLALVSTCCLAGGEVAGGPITPRHLPTLREEAKAAKIVLIGTLENPRKPADPKSVTEKGQTDVRINTIVSGADHLGGRQTVTVDRYIPIEDPEHPPRYIIFCDIADGEPDPYRGIRIESELTAAYLIRSAAIGERMDVAGLDFYFSHIDSRSESIATDALAELTQADPELLGRFAAKLDPDEISRRMKAAPVEQVSVYADLLRHCGRAEHVVPVRLMLNDLLTPPRFSPIDRLLITYVTLRTQEGWAYLRDLIKNPERDFVVRYAGYRAIRFFREAEPKIVPEDELLDVLTGLLAHDDFADLVIEDFRKEQRWEASCEVFELYDKPAGQIPIVNRAIIRYAMSMPTDDEQARALLKKARADDAERVADIEEALEYEREAQEAGGDR